MALVPDVDKARSKAGKAIWPLSWLVEKGIGHRTLTHSWVILLLPALLISDSSVAPCCSIRSTFSSVK
ncbi:metal-dependent hydrolase [Brevibacillus reuszeri]|uniref:metal-dependent hydrolase n=1 Tax=Brevibacillus reuszeri TaxID=54915 RepID=UPI003D250B40